MAELKPCPFCGGKAVIYFMKRHWFTKLNQYCYIVCNNCHAMTFRRNTLEEAINSWNIRTQKNKEDDRSVENKKVKTIHL